MINQWTITIDIKDPKDQTLLNRLLSALARSTLRYKVSCKAIQFSELVKPTRESGIKEEGH